LLPIAIGPIALANLGFGLDVSVRVKTDPGESAATLGEYGWAGAASTHFFVSPGEDLICVAMTQFMPASQQYALDLRKLLYKAIEKPKATTASAAQ
jgi:CubicO group peptidase (beta-lactamase class C family)